jgi:hypothetical protein
MYESSFKPLSARSSLTPKNSTTEEEEEEDMVKNKAKWR